MITIAFTPLMLEASILHVAAQNGDIQLRVAVFKLSSAVKCLQLWERNVP